MSTALIPLFPLSIVLFPGQAVPLHIFEQRYREMTSYCIEKQSPFGIVFIHDGDIAQIGCSALIVKILKEYEDGRSDILITGQSAFRLVGTHEEKSYLQGDIEYFEDELVPVEESISAHLEELFNRCHRVLYGEDAPRFDGGGRMTLAYHVASELPIDVAFRQTLLEVRSDAMRQQLLVARLTEWYPQLEKRDHVRGKATGNGHAKL